MPPLLLASASPRRRALLEEANVRFEIANVGIVELEKRTAPHLSPAQLAEANARLKAAAADRGDGWVLGADTVVTLEGRIFGKPASLEQAHEFLRALSGCTHAVVTGCALLGPGGRELVFHETARVTFRVLEEEAIARYLAAVPVLDKAGAYALQEKGEWLVKAVDGSRSNVVGLPMEKLLPTLRERGLL